MTIPLTILIAIIAAAVILTAAVSVLLVKLADGKKIQRLETALLQAKILLQNEQEKNKWLDSAEKKLRESFEALSARILQSNSAQLMERSKEQLENLFKVVRSDWGTQKQEIKGVVDPLSKGLEQLDKQIRLIEQKREGSYRGLEEHLKNLQSAYQNLNTTTTDLKRALTSSGRMRGKWGEIQLKRIAEMAGMVEHIDFEEQFSVKNDDDENLRPDMIVRLSGGGVMVVDAKAPMSAYLESTQAKTPQERIQRMKDHAQAVRKHMQDLSKKEYWNQFERSPEFVAMLIPYEAGLSAAFEIFPDLFEEAMKNKVVLVTPVTLLALLRVVAYGWMQLSLAKNAQKIATQGRELYNRFLKFDDLFQKIGNSLNSSVNAFNSAAGSMERRLIPSARKLAELGEIETGKEIPPVSILESHAKISVLKKASSEEE